MARTNGNVIPIHRRMKADNRRLMDWERSEYTYDIAHGYSNVSIDDWGVLVEPVDEQVKRAMIPRKRPWWARLMDYIRRLAR